MRIKFEPTLVLQALSALLAFVVTFGLDFLTAKHAALIVALIAALVGVYNALKVRPVAPAIFQTAITAGAALLTGYGLDLSQERIGTFQLVVIAVVAMLTRQQVTPAERMIPTAPAEGVVS